MISMWIVCPKRFLVSRYRNIAVVPFDSFCLLCEILGVDRAKHLWAFQLWWKDQNWQEDLDQMINEDRRFRVLVSSWDVVCNLVDACNFRFLYMKFIEILYCISMCVCVSYIWKSNRVAILILGVSPVADGNSRSCSQRWESCVQPSATICGSMRPAVTVAVEPYVEP